MITKLKQIDANRGSMKNQFIVGKRIQKQLENTGSTNEELQGS